MEYNKESVHNVLAVTYNAVVFIALKFRDNVLHIMMVPITALQPAMRSNPVAKLIHALLKVPNALVIKQVHMPSRKLKATMLQPELASARAQQQHQPHLLISVAPWQVT